MQQSFERAIDNIIAHGDTDIFPFQPEALSFRERRAELLLLLQRMHVEFDDLIATAPPAQYQAFVPNGHAGFRWATQIDSYWNLYLLSLVIEVGGKIESTRVGTEKNVVHSYRFCDDKSADLWDKDFGWRTFFSSSSKIADESGFVVVCDLSEFYRRINHHRLENALKHLEKEDTTRRIMRLLSVFSGGASYGLPIGGPAARLLSELVLNQIDHLVLTRYKFCRFADDYVIAVPDQRSAYAALVFLSEKLQNNQGLVLQRSKTRILSSSEYKSSRPLIADDESELDDDDIIAAKSKLFQISLYYDPYSTNAASDYESLKSSLKNIDIIGILNHEIRKSRIHVPTINRIVQALRHVHPHVAGNAVMTIVTNLETFYPCLSGILILVRHLFDDLPDASKSKITEILCEHLESESHLFITPSYTAYAMRVISLSQSDRPDSILASLATNESTIVRVAAISALMRRRSWMVLSDLKSRFPNMEPVERRLMILASYALSDEGSHWRQRVKKSFDLFEEYTASWMTSRHGSLGGIV